MTGFYIDESHLEQLSPGARRELLDLFVNEVSELRDKFKDVGWDPEANVSYPLSQEEAISLIHTLNDCERKILRVFARSFDGEVGHGELGALLEAIEGTSYDDLGKEMSKITKRVRGIVQNNHAWLFNWRSKDWIWDDANQTYTAGAFFISAPSILVLREALGVRATEAES
jgi:hypothetical protein